MRDLEEYKKYWKNARLDSASLDADNRVAARRLASGRAMTARQSLQRHYLISFIASILMPALAPVLTLIGFPLWVGIIYGAFGIFSATMSACTYYYIKRTDFFGMPTVEALKAAMKLSRRTSVLGISSFSLAFAIICAMLWVSFDNMHEHIFYGLVAGLFIGIPLGFLRFRNKRSQLRRLRDELRTISENE